MSPEELHAKVVTTRARQGLPPTITDPATLERVAAVFRLVALADERPVPPKSRRKRRRPEITSDQGGRPAA